MRSFLFAGLSTVLLILIAQESYGQLQGSSTMPPSQLQGIKSLEKPAEKKTSPARSLPAPIQPAPLVPQTAEYLHPGILVFLNGKWVGSDHLLNLSNNIGVYVTIVKSQNETLEISQEQLHREVGSIFERANIKPVTLAPVGQPPLPAFEIEIFIYPVDLGYAACCQGRLFESVKLERFKMDPNMAFQAITWEKQSLIVGPKDTFAQQLTETVQGIATVFAERFQAYERIKREIWH